MMEIQIVLQEMESGEFSKGNLCLIIACTKCMNQFELNNESVVMAIAMKTSFIEYLKYVQNSKCPKCN